MSGLSISSFSNLGLSQSHSRDSFISYQPLSASFESIQKNGLEAYVGVEMEKQTPLKHLLNSYNDGRSKGFYCLVCQLLPLDGLKEVLADVAATVAGINDIQDRARIARDKISGLADELKIILKLRK